MRCVAGVAEEWCPRLQEIFRCGAMGIVAVGAVLVHWLMAVHERPAFFHVAGVTGIDHGCALHQFRTNGAMRIVAIGTGHLAFDNRMMRRLVDLGALLFVTG